jgi:hypothetical protein
MGAPIRDGAGQTFAIGVVSVSVDPPSIPAGQAANVNVTVPGVAVGDDVLAIPPDTLEAGLVPQAASVPAADTIRVRLYNPTAAAIDGAARTWRFIIFDRTPQT